MKKACVQLIFPLFLMAQHGYGQVTRPFSSGTVLPGSCFPGQIYFRTDRPAGKNLYGCTAAGVWSPMAPPVDVPATAGSTDRILSNNGATPDWRQMGGDITGAPDAILVRRLQGRDVTGSAPGNNQILKWSSATGKWELQDAAAHQHSVTDLNGITRTHGNGSALQMFGGGAVAANDCAAFDANGNVISAHSPCATVTADFAQIFSSATTVVLPHQGNTLTPVVACYDNASPPARLEADRITATDAQTATVTFAVPQSGACIVKTGSGGGSSGAGISQVFTGAGLIGDGSAVNPARIDPNSGATFRLAFTDSYDHGTIANASCGAIRTISTAGVTVADVVLAANPFYATGGLFTTAQPGVNQIYYQLCNLSGAPQAPGNLQYTFYVLRSF